MRVRSWGFGGIPYCGKELASRVDRPRFVVAGSLTHHQLPATGPFRRGPALPQPHLRFRAPRPPPPGLPPPPPSRGARTRSHHGRISRSSGRGVGAPDPLERWYRGGSPRSPALQVRHCRLVGFFPPSHNTPLLGQRLNLIRGGGIRRALRHAAPPSRAAPLPRGATPPYPVTLRLVVERLWNGFYRRNAADGGRGAATVPSFMYFVFSKTRTFSTSPPRHTAEVWVGW